MNPYEAAWKRLEAIWDELLTTAGSTEYSDGIIAKAESVRTFLEGALSMTPRGKLITIEDAAHQLKAMLLETLDLYERSADPNSGDGEESRRLRHQYDVLEARIESAGLLDAEVAK